jgi:two-component system, cell cycle response regulator DivK
MSRKSIMVVEDNPINLKLLNVLLLKHGYEVTTARDAEEALSLLEKFQPQLILMDLQLPGMDGLELTRILKNNPQTKAIKVLALTAYAMKGDEEKAYAAGCDGYITKPFDTRALPKTIAEFLTNDNDKITSQNSEG